MKWWWMIPALSLVACVPVKKFKDLEASKAALEQKLNKKIDDCESRNTDLTAEMRNLEGQRTALDKRISMLYDSLSDCRSQLAENQAYIKSLGDKLDEQKKNLAAELDAKNKAIQLKEIELNNALSRAETERNKMMEMQAELEKTSARVRTLEGELNRKDSAVRALKEEISKALAGFDQLDIKVENRNGKVYVSMADKLLFKSGSTAVDAKGKDALLKLASALNKNPDVQVTVEGHTDNKPMNSEKIKDNWDLSVLRATSIVRILSVEGKMSDKRITATGRGETQPIADNGSAEGRAKNRRTEIILSPRLDKILDILNTN
ncbi:MAG: OmpA family protein [Bacteroidetes bacterium]|nr:OmpA family protein [Bacteroidota bacterium]